MRNYAKKRRMKRYILVTIILSSIAYGLTIYLDKFGDGALKIAQIGEELISEREVNQKIHEIFSSDSNDVQIPAINSLPKEVIETISKEIYLEKQLIKRAKEKNINNNKEVKRKIKREKERILIEAYLDSEIEKNISEENLKQKYIDLSNKIEGKREFLIYHIVTDSQKRANRIYRLYNETSPSRKRKKFAELAKKYSIDKESANNSGKLGYILEDNLIEEIANEILSFKKAGYTKPIKTSFGWHIVLVKKIREAEIPPFEEIYEELKSQVIKDTTDNIYGEIFSDHKISILIDLKEKDEQKK